MSTWVIILIIFVANVVLIIIIGCILYVLNRMRKILIKSREKIEKERKQKIELGIIRFSMEDPYGEENWD